MVWLGVLIFGVICSVVGWIYYRFEYKWLLSAIVPYWTHMFLAEWSYVVDGNFLYNSERVLLVLWNGMCLEGTLMYPCVPVFVLIIHSIVNRLEWKRSSKH